MTLTRGHLGRHFQGKRGGFYPARLDVAQDHLLVHLHGRGLFDLGLVFKGGTSLRKPRATSGAARCAHRGGNRGEAGAIFARWSSRDLYDLVWYGRQGVMDESLIRQLWILKIYQDVVLDRRWRRSFDPGTILLARNEADIDEESIGFLTSPGTIPAWESEFRSRYAFTGSIVMPGPPRTVLSARRSRYGCPPVMVMTRPSADCQCCPADSGACFERVFTTSPTPGDAVRDRPSGS